MKRNSFCTAIVLLLATLGGTGSAAAVSCGDTITTDTTLISDLFCPGSNPGLIVDGAVLDMNGHGVGGNQQGPGIVLIGHGAQVLNGRIQQAAPALRADGSGGHSVRNLWINSNLQGGIVLNSGGNMISDCHVTVGGDFTWIVASSGNMIINSVIGYGNIAAMDVSGDDNEIVGNSISSINSLHDGIHLGGSGNTLSGNVFTNSSQALSVSGDANKVANNVIDGNANGVTVTGNDNTLTANAATNNVGEGFKIQGNNNKLTSNAAVGNNLGFAINGNYNAMKSCDASENFTAGILINTGAQHSTVAKSHTQANGGWGIFVGGIGSKIQKNVALGNNSKDLYDSHVSCADNVWSGNTSGIDDPVGCID